NNGHAPVVKLQRTIAVAARPDAELITQHAAYRPLELEQFALAANAQRAARCDGLRQRRLHGGIVQLVAAYKRKHHDALPPLQGWRWNPGSGASSATAGAGGATGTGAASG